MIRKILKLPLIGPAIRKLATSYPEGSVTTIRTGVARGMKWKRFHRYVNGYWVGSYEADVQAALQRILEPGDVFYDIGANAGFFLLLGSRLVGREGRCVGFDPDPANVESIHWQIKVNGLEDRVQVVAKGVADQAGTATLLTNEQGDPTGHLDLESLADRGGRKEVCQVELTSLDAIVPTLVRPDVLKIDVEGAEVEVLRGGQRTLAEVRPKMIIEVHGPQQNNPRHPAVRELLAPHGYQLRTLDDMPVPDDAPLPHQLVALPA